MARRHCSYNDDGPDEDGPAGGEPRMGCPASALIWAAVDARRASTFVRFLRAAARWVDSQVTALEEKKREGPEVDAEATTKDVSWIF